MKPSTRALRTTKPVRDRGLNLRSKCGRDALAAQAQERKLEGVPKASATNRQ